MGKSAKVCKKESSIYIGELFDDHKELSKLDMIGASQWIVPRTTRVVLDNIALVRRKYQFNKHRRLQ